MENALWNGKKLLAHEVAADYYREKEVGKASYQEELCCPDPECRRICILWCQEACEFRTL